jgi:segregation and condensation protein A
MADYQVQLDVFEGPMDLLIYLIRKNEIDIYDIPIALITDQYVSYLDRMEMLDLEKAGDFLLLAATLLQIKSRMLLPGEISDDEQYEDPRTELVEKILEYLQFKEIADHMRDMEKSSLGQAERGFSELGLEDDNQDPQVEATVNELILAFGRLLLKVPPPEPVHRVATEQVSAAERTEEIRKMLSKKRKLLFSDLLEGRVSRMFLVVTLVALLELARRREIVIEQDKLFSEIWIARKKGQKAATKSGASKKEAGKADGQNQSGKLETDKKDV